MNTPKPTAVDVINAVSETLDVICKARGVELDALGEAMVDKRLWSSSEGYLGDGSLVADSFDA